MSDKTVTTNLEDIEIVKSLIQDRMQSCYPNQKKKAQEAMDAFNRIADRAQLWEDFADD